MTPPRHALLLTAGLGTRLRPLTLVRAKPALPVAGVPLVCRITQWLVAHGVTELVLNLHHLPATIASVMGDGGEFGARVRYSWEQPVVLGSAGGPRQALDIIGASPFLIVNGDTLTDVDLEGLAAAHAATAAAVTMALVANHEPLKYGGVRLDEKARVIGFAPRGSAAAGSYHFVGVQMAEASAFRAAAPGQPANSVGDIYDQLVTADPGAIRGFVTAASFQDIGTVADYWQTSQALAAAEGTTRPDGCIVWDDVAIADGAVLQDCIVTDGVAVPPGAAHRRAALIRSGDSYVAHAF